MNIILSYIPSHRFKVIADCCSIVSLSQNMA